MLKKIQRFLINFISSRTFFLYVMFVVMAVLLFQRIFTLQIVQGEDKQQEFELKIKKERSIASTRGNIYDVNGIALAYNELSSSVTIEDVYEPYLLQLGFIARTPRGRVVLPKAYEHLGRPVPAKALDQIRIDL